MLGEHHYAVEVEWQGDRGEGTSAYRAYGRQHVVRAAGKLHDIAGSSDWVFHGDRDRWNPEELLLAALSQCHMLSYLHVATRTACRAWLHGCRDGHHDRRRPRRRGVHRGDPASAGLVADASMLEPGRRIHAEAAELCFIAASVAFPVHHRPTAVVAGES